MRTIVGCSNRILEIDLSTGQVQTVRVSDDDRKRYLGGKGLGLKLLHDRLEPGIDPLGAENYLAFMMGVLMGTAAPCSARFSALTKSPLTGIMVHASCGGAFGMAFKTAGFDGLLVTGRAPAPVVIDVDEKGARVLDAGEYWGLDTLKVQRELNPHGEAGVLTIGPAGENRVRFANLASGQIFSGRGGFGAVMGAKHLKAIVARGKTCKIVPADPKGFTRAKARASAYIARSPVTADDYPNYGTASHVNWCNDGGILPVKNFQAGSHPMAERVSGQAMRQRYHATPDSCISCSIKCGHQGRLPDGSLHRLPEYEDLALLGPNLEIFDPDAVTAFNDRCGRLGLDPVSAGSVLAWCMEAGEKGLIETPLRFGITDGITRALDEMAHRRGFGDEMAGGTRRLSRRYGGAAFAMQVKGLEISAYDPRGAWGQALAYAVANQGACHLSAATFFLEVGQGLLDPYTTRAKARFVKYFEDLYAAVNSLHACQFSAYAYLFESPMVRHMPGWLLRLVMRFLPTGAIGLMDAGVYAMFWRSMTGRRLSQRQMLKAGARIHLLERSMNVAEGISRKDDTLPRRFMTKGRRSDYGRRAVPLHLMLKAYYRLRGYDLQGIPIGRQMKQLGLDAKWKPASDRRLAGFKIISAGRSRTKRAYLSLLFWLSGRVVQAAARADRKVGEAFDAIPDGYTFALAVAPDGPAMVMGKPKSGRVKYLGTDVATRFIDLELILKSTEAAFLLFTCREALATAMARGRLRVRGDLPKACILIGILEQVAALVLPERLATRAARHHPQGAPIRKYAGRVLICLRALVGL